MKFSLISRLDFPFFVNWNIVLKIRRNDSQFKSVTCYISAPAHVRMPLDGIQAKCGLQRKSPIFIDFVYEYTVIKLKLNKVSIWVSNILDINFNKVKKTFWFCHFNLYFHGTWVFRGIDILHLYLILLFTSFQLER